MAHEVEPPITGKVAEVIDRYSLIINKGESAGVQPGMIFVVMGKGGDVIDPETGDSLGPRPVEKLRVRIRDVYEKFSVAETYRIVTPTSLNDILGGRAMLPTSLTSFATSILEPARPERERLAGAPQPEDREPTDPVVSISVGDTVRQLAK